MRRIALLFPLIFLLAGCPVPAVASVTVSGSNVQDVNGVPLFTGQWCFGATCLTVTNGSFSGSITPGTQTVTVVNGSSVTILSVSDVTITANYNWNNYTVPYGVTFTGNGAPYLACQMSALYTQLDVSPNPTFLCVAQGGQLVWKLQGPATPAGPGIISGLGVPTLPAVVPTIYVRTDVAEQYSVSGLSGSVSSTWTGISGGGGGGPNFADNEILAGSGTAWTFANVPISALPISTSVHLYVLQYEGGNFIRLPPSAIVSITGTAMVTAASWSAGSLMADYRY
jgi:hypothetical protein